MLRNVRADRNSTVFSHTKAFVTEHRALDRLKNVLFALSLNTVKVFAEERVNAYEALPPCKKRQVKSCTVKSVVEDSDACLRASRTNVWAAVLYGVKACVVAVAAVAVVLYGASAAVVAVAAAAVVLYGASAAVVAVAAAIRES